MAQKNDGGPTEGGPRKSKKRRLGKKAVALIVIAVIGLVLVVGLWGMWGGTGYLTVGDVTANQGKYLDKYVEVRGTVQTGSLDTGNSTFNLTEKSSELRVNYTGALPSNFEEGKDVVIKGTLRSNGGLVLVAKEITVGCASKY